MTSLVVSEAKVRRPALTLQQLLNAREKVFRSQWEFLLFRKMIPSPACRRSRGRRGDGILNIRPDLECAGRAKRRRRFGLFVRLIATDPKRRRTSFAAAIQIFVIAIAALLLASCSRSGNVSSSSATRAVTDEAGRRVVLP